MTQTKGQVPGQYTLREIHQQPETWRKTVPIVRAARDGSLPPAVLTGAGTSAYAAIAVESACPGSRAVASTELFIDYQEPLRQRRLVVSFARSGNSPESTAVVQKIQEGLPEVRHLAVTCNKDGKLARWPGVEAIVLPPETNDRSLVMTSSFSNLVLAGVCLGRQTEVEEALPAICAGGETVLREFAPLAESIGKSLPERMVTLASAPLFGVAREACLKTQEMTAGRIAVMAETYLGLRHGPMSFIGPDTLVLCFISSDPKRRRYELDLAGELRDKGIGRLVALAPADADSEPFHEVVSTEASSLPDYLRGSAEIVFPQLLGFHFSLAHGLNPDSPSPGGVINRVVQGVNIYAD